jgi:STE24 endopeptidase
MNEDKATRYQRLKRQASVASLAWTTVLLTWLLATGASASLRDLAESWAAGGGGPHTAGSGWAVVFYVVLLSAVNGLGALPIAFYSGFVLERRFVLSNERLGRWVRDRAKASLVGLALACGAATMVYAFIRLSPAGWWLPAGVLCAALVVGLTKLAPVLLLPLFYRVRPLERDSLRTRLLQLAERAGARVLGAYEWGLSDRTKKANAALAGLGGTRRILVSDTILAEYSDEEIEVVLAHELAHHVHGDIWKGLAFECALILAGFYAASVLLANLAPTFSLRGVADVAGLPLLVLAAGGVSLVAVPAALAMSRAFERSADRFALDLTGNPGAFISAMKRLGAQNLAEERPSRLVRWLFCSHPPVIERIAAAQALVRDTGAACTSV